MNSKLFVFLLAIAIMSCEKEPIITNNTSSNTSSNFESINLAMRPYFIKFELEANKRGLSYEEELNTLKTDFENITQQGVAGQCTWNSAFPNEVTIDTPFWNRASPSQREWVMFHELGHCILNREHSEVQNQNGICLSIMASGIGNCQSLYNNQNREYYLNELFSIQQ